MSKRAERAAYAKYPPKMIGHGDVMKIHRHLFKQGYETGENETLERAAKWWYDHTVGFLKEGIAKNVVEEFKQAMLGDEESETQ